MNTKNHQQNRHSFMTKLSSLVGVMGVSLLVAIPAVANMHNQPKAQETSQSVTGDTTTQQPTQSVDNNQTTTENQQTSSKQNLVAVAAANPSFKTLAQALKATQLDEKLAAEGPFTIFAPTDAAFAALPEGKLEMLMKPENKDKLAKILTYHVVPGELKATDLKSGALKTAEGSTVEVKVESETVMVNDAKVVQPNVQASNGVIHVIDKVIMPSQTETKK